ncbi:S8 family serine peptidase [Microvirga sp. Mcv34]|uniref:S8 family serine peptidase n=1 Tax=Microvirga sp. Mcv34 TaxID=2926016 RepID=UPI003966B98E
MRTGTSYAVPFVSAAAGLVLASNRALDAKAVRSRLEEYTRDLGTPGRDPTFGFGLIQMAGLCDRPAEPPAIKTTHDQPAAAPLNGQSAGMP